MTVKTKQIRIADYNYPLPNERIARFPLEKRDESKLLLYRNGEIGESRFNHLPELLPKNSLVVFNNTRVIQARLLFRKSTGAKIELFCLEPIIPHDYALVFQQTGSCSWLCLIGNAKKWKTGILEKEIHVGNRKVTLCAEKKESYGESHLIHFSW
ncbi:MAG: S-adenosylmethionine:tRNA ribosyltransferase-isomerase, partial [Massilibacteroides sp.]|nr:S-adenosylmethionine:tRNA ribosyltransferase-isomerase [Massilibacteroides sp.]